jgi:hypothetical protein
MKYFAAMLLGWFGNPLEWWDLWRIWCSVAGGLVVAGMGYWYFLPEALPVWPGLIVVCVATAVGFVWQRASEIR